MSDVRCHETGYVWHGEPLEVCESEPPDEGSLWGAISCWWNCSGSFEYSFETDACRCLPISQSERRTFFVPAMWRGR